MQGHVSFNFTTLNGDSALQKHLTNKRQIDNNDIHLKLSFVTFQSEVGGSLTELENDAEFMD